MKHRTPMATAALGLLALFVQTASAAPSQPGQKAVRQEIERV